MFRAIYNWHWQRGVKRLIKRNLQLQRTVDGGHWTLDTGRGDQWTNRGKRKSGAQTKPIWNCIPRCTARDLPFQCAVEPFMLFLQRVSISISVSVCIHHHCQPIRSCSLSLSIRPVLHTIPQSQWGRHETPLLEGTLSAQRHHYFTPAKLKAQSRSMDELQMEMGIRRQEDRKDRRGERAVCGSGKRAHKNGINIMAKLRTSCRSQT